MWACPTSIIEFLVCVVHTCVGVRKLVEAEMTMTMTMKVEILVVIIDEYTPKICFRCARDPGRT